ncbi:GTP cyclohydrolase I [Pullulanibacillus pueri]|uniref:GTP cyclohydrolase FolE2 n=1 Tax=Pullulanibacillus pueri TaxID=1437324 RepID=A0A8J2ZYU4_9BACL|nr:GTP cyclohydrolase FolE2 [Pullulanibacillus pueri]MBM7683401.1 GTP cyclohydrolase I [Pullulanibacillus pueri]GGH86476.1 GTP cyclohydrolase FolE2 [Pullulanibacillus pueri]
MTTLSKTERLKLFGSVEPSKKQKPTKKEDMKDLQNALADYLFSITQVGVSELTLPVLLNSDTSPFKQAVQATFQVTSQLPRERKGVNMSRYVEKVTAYCKNEGSLDLSKLRLLIKEIAEYCELPTIAMKVQFRWFYDQIAPVTGLTGMNIADGEIYLTYDPNAGYKQSVQLEGTATTLCPCSKEISEYGAHNQRGHVKIQAELPAHWDGDWKTPFLKIIESNSSSPIYPILKREDEKYVTEKAYENPRFVEDFVRLVAAELCELPWVESFHVRCENDESIHLHKAYAEIKHTPSDRHQAF